jgi:hypothetical protein
MSLTNQLPAQAHPMALSAAPKRPATLARGHKDVLQMATEITEIWQKSTTALAKEEGLGRSWFPSTLLWALSLRDLRDLLFKSFLGELLFDPSILVGGRPHV